MTPAAHPVPGRPEAVLEHLVPGTNIIVPLANGEPATLLDVVEAHAENLDNVRVHQMHTLHDRPYLDGRFGTKLRHVSYFLSPVTRRHFAAGTVDLVPANFSEVPLLMPRVAPAPRGRRGLATGPPRLLLARHQRRLRVLPRRPRSAVPRGQPSDAPHVRP